MDQITVKIHGTATIERRNGRFGFAERLVVRPATSWSWVIEGPAFVDGVFRPHNQTWPEEGFSFSLAQEGATL